ncbi:MAG: flavodoxin family protein [Eubacteriales bacterium]|nr:flavodoxin family protein [Eubacteriales bacterium]
MKYAIVFSSRSGNTKMLADAIREELPQDKCVYFGAPDESALKVSRLYIGFWTDKGICDAEAKCFLERLQNKEVFLFGTAGFGASKAYYKEILHKTAGVMNDSNHTFGAYMCQGRMPVFVKDRYEQLMRNPNHGSDVEQMMDRFTKSLTHPDENDLRGVRRAVRKVTKLTK